MLLGILGGHFFFGALSDIFLKHPSNPRFS